MSGRNRLLIIFGSALALLMGFGMAGPLGAAAVLLTLSLVNVLLRSRIVARARLGIGWKFLAAISLMASLFFFASLINFREMDYMHERVHQITDLVPMQPNSVAPALDALHDYQHGLLFSLTPLLLLLATLVGLGLGLAMALAVIDPVRKIGQAMRRIAAGESSPPVEVENRDELGALADQINRTAQELARLQEATLADERARSLRERIAQVTLAQEAERRRISRELHDDLGPSLAAIGNRLRACQHMVNTDPRGAQRELEDVIGSLKGHVQGIRHLIYDLRPLALDQLGLVEALKQQVERFGQEIGVQASFSASGQLAPDPLIEMTVFRVVQECLSNVQKHARATQVEVDILGGPRGLEVTIQDNGVGFSHGQATSGVAGEGVGLVSMRERAELLGGRLSVLSSPGKGCRIALHIPFKETAVGAHTSPAS